MTVLSPAYFLFLLLLWISSIALRAPKQRQVLLLAGSLAFYGTSGLGFLGLLLLSAVFNFFWGRVLSRSPTLRNLWAAIGTNILWLALFKYVPSLSWLFPPGSLVVHLVVPLGVSFWTFQALSYLMDVYRGEELDPTPVEFLLYMSFWPTVASGPVCRLPEMLPKFRQMERTRWTDIEVGVTRIILGLFLKLVPAQILADGIAPGEGMNVGFDQMSSWGGIDVWMLGVAYGFHLFFDFSGYSHIVIGSARLFGLVLPENFERPYFSTTPSLFWTRWHMSLSSWIRDYVFLPLATTRREHWWRHFVLALSMVVFGLWHNATWPFLLWGAYHGTVLVLHRLIQRFRFNWGLATLNWLEQPLSWCVTMLVICLGWVLFRARDVHQIGQMLHAIGSPSSYRRLTLRPNFYIVTCAVVVAYYMAEGVRELVNRFAHRFRIRILLWIGAPVYYAMMIYLTIAWSQRESAFVYFAF